LKPDVENDERGAPLLDDLKGLVAVLGKPCAVSFILEDAGNEFSNICFIVDD
jgi:hypothetical protein